MQETVFFNDEGYRELEKFLNGNNFSKTFILVDTHTHEFCLPKFLQKLKTGLPFEVIETEPGEENKSLETCTGIWNTLSDFDADRKSLIINLGGGVITDLGGFVALCFKRGISFVNFPTTLLAMVDAAVGGKTGVNLGSLKNQIGIIKPAELVIVDIDFLQSLPASQMRSGLAEMLKHGLINNREYWEKLISFKDLSFEDLEDLIRESIEIKEKIVSQDPSEKALRKTLNFGHTLGHAIESYYLGQNKKPKLLHGEAVAAGMLLEAFISSEVTGLPKQDLIKIKEVIFSFYEKISFDAEEIQAITELLKFDKKNENGNIHFVLLEEIGKPVIDRTVPGEIILNSFRYYLD